MTLRLLALTALLGGCLVVPATTTTTRTVGTDYGDPSLNEPRGLDVETRETHGSFRVTARRRGMCVRPVYRLTAVTSSKHARLGGSDDPRARAFGALFAVVTLPISGLVTGLVVAADRPETEQRRTLVARQHFPCTVAGTDVGVEVALPTGATVKTRTDASGRAQIDVPASEPYQGVATLRAAGVEPRTIKYALPRPAYVVARDAVLGCAASHGVTGHVDLKVTINDTGFVTRVWLSTGDAAYTACVAPQLAGVRFPTGTYARTIRLPLVIAAATP